MTHLLVRVWRRKGDDAKWEEVAGPMPVHDGVQIEVDGNRAKKDSGWHYTTFPAGGNPNHV